MEDTSFFESLLTWGAVILYFGAMLYKSVKGENKKVEQKKTVRPVVRVVPPAEKIATETVFERKPIQQMVETPPTTEGVHAVETPEVEIMESPKRKQLSAKQRRLRNAIIWGEILKPKFN